MDFKQCLSEVKGNSWLFCKLPKFLNFIIANLLVKCNCKLLSILSNNYNPDTNRCINLQIDGFFTNMVPKYQRGFRKSINLTPKKISHNFA